MSLILLSCFAFLEGFALILSPCILPILPIILASTLVTTNIRRPLGIVLGFIVLFAVVAFFARQVLQGLAIDLTVLRYMAYGLLALLGILMLLPSLHAQFTRLLQRGMGITPRIMPPMPGFWRGFMVGGLVAIIWTPCAGPILAAVIVQLVVQPSVYSSLFTLLAFALGVAIPMLLIALYGQQLMRQLAWFKQHGHYWRRLLGIVILASVAYMLWQERATPIASQSTTPIKTANFLLNGLWRPYPAPELTGIQTWLNSPPLQLRQLKKKVILVDFWTYSCINCIRTLPYLKQLNQRYRQQGLVIIGVHAPEFAFERDIKNVQLAIKRFGLTYPIAIDNQFATWRQFHNHAWPAHYLINQQGQVVYQRIGEGQYDVLENNIRYLLGIHNVNANPMQMSLPFSFTQTPETYLGYGRADSKHAPQQWRDQTHTYTYPSPILRHAWALQGQWQIAQQHITAIKPQAAIKIHFYARKVYVVMGSPNKPIGVSVWYKGKRHLIQVHQQKLYTVLSLPKVMDGMIELCAEQPGLEMYTFTFGN